MISPPKLQIYWDVDKFVAPDEAVASHFESLRKNRDRITKILCLWDFDIHSYKITGNKIFVYKTNHISSSLQNTTQIFNPGIESSENEEGKGFIICLHLLGYLLDENYDVKVIGNSFRYYLHPTLYRHLSKVMIRVRSRL